MNTFFKNYLLSECCNVSNVIMRNSDGNELWFTVPLLKNYLASECSNVCSNISMTSTNKKIS